MHPLTIITVSHNNPAGLRSLHEQLRPALSDKALWLIKDSGMSRESDAWAANLDCQWTTYVNTPDTGIYDALNQALAITHSDFYLTVGSDDKPSAEGILHVVNHILQGKLDGIDIASFPVIMDGRIHKNRFFTPSFVSVSGLISSHSVGTVIRRRTHDQIGQYSTKYKILADSFFIRRCYQQRLNIRSFSSPVLGEFSTGGISSTHHARRILEAYTYNVECGDPPWLQTLIMGARLVKLRPKSLLPQ